MSEAYVDGDRITLEMVGDAWKIWMKPAGGGDVKPAQLPIFPTPEEALAAMTETAKDIKR